MSHNVGPTRGRVAAVGSAPERSRRIGKALIIGVAMATSQTALNGMYPAMTSGASNPETIGYAVGSVQARKTVLIVDDERDIQETVAELLADGNYRALAANNGQDALEQLKAMDEKPCVILLDLKMPVMDGFEFRAAQQADPALNGIPVIAVTANYQARDVANLRFAAFVRKPLNGDMLLDSVDAVARHSSGSTEVAWRRVTGEPERWERSGFGAVEARGPGLWSALPTCGHNHFCSLDRIEAQQLLEERIGLCVLCWYHSEAFWQTLRPRLH